MNLFGTNDLPTVNPHVLPTIVCSSLSTLYSDSKLPQAHPLPQTPAPFLPQVLISPHYAGPMVTLFH